MLHGKEYAAQAHQQAYRTVDLLGARGAIVDDRGRLIAGTTGHVVIDADAAALGSRDPHGVWHPSAEGRKEIARLAKFAGTPKRQLVRRIAHDVLQAPFAPAVVIADPRPALTNYLQERGRAVPRLQGRGGCNAELSARRLRQLFPRPSRPDQQAGAQGGRLRERAGRPSRRAERRRGRVRLRPRRRLRQGAHPGRLARAEPGPTRLSEGEAAADAPALDRRAPPAGGRERGLPRDGRRAHGRLQPDRRLGGRDRSVDRRDQGNRDLPDVQPEARRDELALPRASLRRYDGHPDAQPRDRGRVSDRLDVQADHRGGRPERRDHHAVHVAALLRLVRPRQPHVLQRRARRVRDDGSADGARAVVRHVVLPARRPDLGGGSVEEGDADPALGAPPRAWDDAADRPHRSDGGLPPVPERVLRAAHRDAVLRGPGDQPLDRAGRAAGQPAPARGRVLGAHQRRHGRPPTRRRGRDPERRETRAQVQARAEA